jgi:hypothetical protein
MSFKICNECNIEKDTSLFSRNCGGFRSKCKDCTRKNKSIKTYESPIEGVFKCCDCKIQKSYDKFNRDVYHSRGLSYFCKDCASVRNKKRLEKTPEYSKEQSRKRRSDIKNRIRLNLGTRLYLAVQKKHGNTMELTGCSKDELFEYIESKFTEGMNWENYGKWHIDHIKPCASFDLTRVEEQKKCFHWKNLQPLWAIDNMKKGAKYVSVAELGSRHQA